jgi:hypothetical protein
MPPWWWARVGLRLPLRHAFASSSTVLGEAPGMLVVGRSIAQWVWLRTLSLAVPSSSASMWVAHKCRVKAMPVVSAGNGDTLRYCLPSCRRCYGALVLPLRPSG